MYQILLVEDDSAIYQPLTSFLRGEGFAVRQASGQREALALLEQDGLAYVWVPGGTTGMVLCGDPYFEAVYKLI